MIIRIQSNKLTFISESDFVFPVNAHHGEKKTAYEQNMYAIRRALKLLPGDCSLVLIRVLAEKEPSQSRKRKMQKRSLPAIEKITIDNISEKKNQLSKHQILTIELIANSRATSFREPEYRRVAELCEMEIPEDPEMDELAVQFESQTSNFSDDLPREKKQSMITRNDLKESCLLLSTERNICPASINATIEEVFSKVPNSNIETFDESSLRRHLPLVGPLLHRQEVAFIEDAESLSIGLDSTTISGNELHSFTILSNTGESLFFDIQKVNDHSSATVAKLFEKKMSEFPENIQLMIAQKTQMLNSDRARAAVSAVGLIRAKLDQIHRRERVFCPCTMHIVLNGEKFLRKSLPEDILEHVSLMEKILSTHRLHQTKSSKGASFLTFLKVKAQLHDDIIPEALSLYSNVRFNVFTRNLENMLTNLDFISEYMEREEFKKTSEFITKNKTRIQYEFLATILLFKNILLPWWSKIRSRSDAVFYETLQAQLETSFEQIAAAESPSTAIRSRWLNLMLDDDSETALFRKIADSIQFHSMKELDQSILTKMAGVKDVFYRFRIQDDTSSLEGEVTWTNQLAEMVN